MIKNTLKLAASGLMLAALANVHASAAPDDDHPAVKRAVDFPPSADLTYSISARQRGFNLNGDATLTWRVGGGKYSIGAESRVALVGFGNETFSSLTEPKLTTIDQRCEEMGGAAIRLLLEMIQNDTQTRTPRKIVLRPELLKRASSAQN